jgi:hypothetical protein
VLAHAAAAAYGLPLATLAPLLAQPHPLGCSSPPRRVREPAWVTRPRTGVR